MKKRGIGIIFIMLALFIGCLQLYFASLVFGEDGIYNSTNSNVSSEVGFAHLNLSNLDIALYYPFDIEENVSENITYDYTNNGNDGSLHNGILFNSSGGIYGGGYEFDGVDDYIDMGSIISNSTNNSVSFWIKFNEAQDVSIISPESGDGTLMSVRIISNDRIYFRPDGGGTTLLENYVYNFNNNEYYNIILTREDQDLKCYVNGQEITGTGYIATGNPNSDYRYLGVRKQTNDFYLNGSLDEVTIWNRSLSATEVAQIYNSTYPRFYPTGEMLFQNLNFGTNNTVNISIPLCQQLNGSFFQFKINDGSYSNLDSNCQATSYSASGDLSSANLTLLYDANGLGFYSPVLYGNITLDSLDNVSSIVTISSPTNGSTSTSSSVSISVITDENATCNYSTDLGITNSSLTANSTGTGHTGTASSLSNGDYTLDVYCEDLQGNTNNTQNVSFTVAVPAPQTDESGSSSPGTGSRTYKASYPNLKGGYSVKVTKGQEVELGLESDGLVNIKSITDNKITLIISNQEYSFPSNSSAKIDLDNDGNYDLQITINSIIGRFADLEFKLISEEVEAGTKENFNESVATGNRYGEELPEEVKKNRIVYLSVIIIILLIIFFVISRKKK